MSPVVVTAACSAARAIVLTSITIIVPVEVTSIVSASEVVLPVAVVVISAIVGVSIVVAIVSEVASVVSSVVAASVPAVVSVVVPAIPEIPIIAVVVTIVVVSIAIVVTAIIAVTFTGTSFSGGFGPFLLVLGDEGVSLGLILDADVFDLVAERVHVSRRWNEQLGLDVIHHVRWNPLTCETDCLDPFLVLIILHQDCDHLSFESGEAGHSFPLSYFQSTRLNIENEISSLRWNFFEKKGETPEGFFLEGFTIRAPATTMVRPVFWKHRPVCEKARLSLVRHLFMNGRLRHDVVLLVRAFIGHVVLNPSRLP